MKTLLITAMIAMATPAFADCDFDKQVGVLALNMYHEARGEGVDGMQMVGEVTLNRVEHPRYPNNICSVVYATEQFSWTHTRKDHTPYETEVWEIALELAKNLVTGEIELFDNGATHFLNPNTVRRIPSWARKFEQVGQIGNHVFYQKPHG